MIEVRAPELRADDFVDREKTATISAERERVLKILASRNISFRSLVEIKAAKGIWYFVAGYGFLAITFLLWRVDLFPLSWIVLLAIPFIQHAFFNIVHEASHLLLNRNPRFNDLYGNLFAFPIGTTVESYRIVHVDHHRYLNSQKDPSNMTTQQGQSSLKVIKNLLLGLCGRYLFLLIMSVIKGNASTQSRAEVTIQRRRFRMMVLFHLVLFGVAVLSGSIIFWLAWIISANSLLPFLESIRTIVEHRKMRSDPPQLHTRSYHKNRFLSAFSAPFFQYHWEHHLFPAIPHYNLRRLHALLTQESLPEVQPVPFYKTLVRILAEDISKKS